MVLNGREILVLEAKCRNMKEPQALEYLKSHGHKISPRTYYRTLGGIKKETNQRLYEIAKNQKEYHLERIDKFRTIETLLWESLEKCSDIMDRVKIMREIREIQIYISAFDEATAGVIEMVREEFGKDDEDQTPSLSTLDGTET